MKYNDDFDWQSVYPAAHKQQTLELEQEHQFDLPKEHQVVGNKLIYDGKPLVKNAEFLL